jgi:hypothetical protein
MTTKARWQRVKRSRKCPICNHADWCLIAPDNTAAICMRVPSNREKRIADGSIAWIHQLGPSTPAPREYAAERADEIRLDVAAVLRRYSMDTQPAALAEFAGMLGVTAASLARLGAVWSRRHNAWAFPMHSEFDGFWEPVGIRMRAMNGEKWSVKGSHPGLFIASDRHAVGPVVICEGPTDNAAMLDLGFDAIGRASCNGCAREIAEYLKLPGSKEMPVIIADTDLPGRLGAVRLAIDLARPVKIITPLKGKDARAWKQAGATAATINALIQNTKPATGLHAQARDLTAQIEAKRRQTTKARCDGPEDQ